MFKIDFEKIYKYFYELKPAILFLFKSNHKIPHHTRLFCLMQDKAEHFTSVVFIDRFAEWFKHFDFTNVISGN